MTSVQVITKKEKFKCRAMVDSVKYKNLIP